MTHPASPSLAFRRSLHIIRALQRQNLDQEALQAIVSRQEGEDAYNLANPSAATKAFEGDVARARDQWGITIRYDQRQKHYYIQEVSDLGWLDLPDETLAALAVVYRTFGPDAPQAEPVRRALDQLLAWLPEARRGQVISQNLGFDLQLRGLDQSIAPDVIERLKEALERKQVIRFWHRSPRNPEEQAHRYEVEPDTLGHMEGHWYLEGYVRWVGEGTERSRPERSQRFRVSYILPEGLEITSEKCPPTPRGRRSFLLRFRLHPDIARGQISARFDQMKIRPMDNGWAEVIATAHDEFHAAQTLFRYGDKCIVLEPAGVVALIRRWLWGMLEHYAPPDQGHDEEPA